MSASWSHGFGFQQSTDETSWPPFTTYDQIPCIPVPGYDPGKAPVLAYGGYTVPLPTPPVTSGDIEYPKAKKSRAAQACDQCRSRKQRCDEGNPCSYCKEFALDCKYQPTPPTKFDKVAEMMITWISAHSEGLRSLVSKLERLEDLIKLSHNGVIKSEPIKQASMPQNTVSPVRKPGSQRGILQGKTSANNPIHTWSCVLDLLNRSEVTLDRYRLIEAEDRPNLSFSTATEAGISNGLPVSTQEPSLSCSDQPQVGVELGKRKRASPDALSPHKHSNTLPPRMLEDLYLSFVRNIHRIHPFLDLVWLRYQLGPFAERNKAMDAPRALGSKRQKVSLPGQVPYRNGFPQTTGNYPEDAIILLVLALGDVAQHQDSLQHTSGFAAEEDQPHATRAPQVIPGISYYSKAMKIVGLHMDGSGLHHAQVFILAGLYKAQLARVNEAASWYAKAEIVLLHLIQRRQLFSDRTEAGAKLVEKPRGHHADDHRTLWAAWTCIELKGDIIDELRLPASGLEDMADRLQVPSINPPDDPSKVSADCWYDSQGRRAACARIKLQRSLISGRLRSDRLDEYSTSAQEIQKTFKQQATVLQHWRRALAVEFQWQDRDPPPADSLIAHLRSTYWRTRATILIPFLDHALHFLPSRQRGVSIDHVVGLERRTAHGSHGLTVIDGISTTSDPDEILLIARLCIHAMKQSMAAFDGVSGRLIMPNIQTVAHERFEAAVILAAVHDSGRLEDCISEEELRFALLGTIKFLEDLSPSSPVCSIDLSVLVGIKNRLFAD